MCDRACRRDAQLAPTILSIRRNIYLRGRQNESPFVRISYHHKAMIINLMHGETINNAIFFVCNEMKNHWTTQCYMLMGGKKLTHSLTNEPKRQNMRNFRQLFWRSAANVSNRGGGERERRTKRHICICAEMPYSRMKPLKGWWAEEVQSAKQESNTHTATHYLLFTDYDIDSDIEILIALSFAVVEMVYKLRLVSLLDENLFLPIKKTTF